MPNILYVVDGLGLSGKTRMLAYLAAHVDRSRFRSAVCTFTHEQTALADELDRQGVPVHTVPCRDGLDFGVVPRLARLMRAAGADVVHCYNPRPMLYAGLAARCGRVRAAIGSLSAFACQVPDRAYGFLPQKLHTSSRRNVYRNRLASRLMRYLVTVSAGLGRRFCEYNGVPVGKLRVVPYGADLKAFDAVAPEEAASIRRGFGFGDDAVVVGSVGRLVEQKDYPTQLKAFALASAREPRLRMVLAGDGPLDTALRALACALGIDDRVRFLGRSDRVPAVLRGLDIYVLASKFEPFGVSVLEAKAAGLPIVATSVNEIPEILGDGRSGLLCPAEQPEAMAQAFVRLARDPSAREQLGRRALLEARERHGLDAAVREYQNLYDACVP